MKAKYYLLIGFSIITINCCAQKVDPWAKWSWLIGEWKGEGSGQPGQGGGFFSFTTDLGGKVLVRKSHTEYPSKENRPAFIHDDLMYVYLDFDGNPTKAIYFDNEGHILNFSIAYYNNSIILLSDKLPNGPFFRLSYSLLDPSTAAIKFEMSQDGEKFITYLEGKGQKIK